MEPMQAEQFDRVAGPWSTTSLAKVEAVEGSSVAVSSASFGRLSARLAVSGYRPRPGDAVLVTRTDDGAAFVVGVVQALRRVEEPLEVRAANGARAVRAYDEAGEEVLELRAQDGALLVEHHPESGRLVIHAPGQLALRAAGDLCLDAAGAVRVRAGTELELSSRGDLSIGATDLEGHVRSALRMREGRAQLEAEHLGAKAERADVAVNEVNLVARTLRTLARRVKQDAEVLETTAARLVERTKEAWRETEGLSQTRAGRLRLVAETSLTALGSKALVRAREDVKIEGEKIHLG